MTSNPFRTRRGAGWLRLATAAAAACALMALPATIAGAQGTIAAQGFGYPPGQLSTRALSTGGALGEVDPRSPLNPAALAIGPAAQVYAQYDPELRNQTGPGGSAHSVVARFPNVGAVIPLGGRLVAGLGVTTLTDRSWATTSTRSEVLGPDTVSATESLRSEGGISDVRLALAYAASQRLRVGAAVHAYTGSDRVTSNQVFSDTLRFHGVSQVSNASFSGRAVSAGVEFDLLPRLGLALDVRKGFGIRMYAGDSVITHATVPDRYAGSISFQGIPGTVVSIRAARERWSSLTPLSTTGSRAVDVTDYGAGLESRGPRFGSSAMLVRAGVRSRTLPFPAAGSTVRETSFGGGIGIPVAYDHVTLDLAAMRNSRTGVRGVSESGYTFSVGLRVQP